MSTRLLLYNTTLINGFLTRERSVIMIIIDALTCTLIAYAMVTVTFVINLTLTWLNSEIY